jgi:hypothetical protein
MNLYVAIVTLLLSAVTSHAFFRHTGSLAKSSLTSQHLLQHRLCGSTRRLVISKDDSDEDELEFMYETGFTKRKKGASWKKTDNRDSLPFVVSANTADGKLTPVGTYLLDSSTGCGDLLDLSGNIFLVQRVSYLYKYESGGFRVFKKKLDVTSTKASWSDTVTPENGQQFLQ